MSGQPRVVGGAFSQFHRGGSIVRHEPQLESHDLSKTEGVCHMSADDEKLSFIGSPAELRDKVRVTLLNGPFHTVGEICSGHRKLTGMRRRRLSHLRQRQRTAGEQTEERGGH